VAEEPSHVAVERLAIRKLTLKLISQVVQAGIADAVLLSVTNAPALEDVLRHVSDGVSAPPVARTCLLIFRHLVEGWCCGDGKTAAVVVAPGGVSGAVLATGPDGSVSVRPGGFLHHVLAFVVPDAVGALLDPTFDGRDATAARIVGEVAELLRAVRERCPPEDYERCFVAGLLYHRLGCPLEIIDSFRRSAGAAEIGGCLKCMMAAAKNGLKT